MLAAFDFGHAEHEVARDAVSRGHVAIAVHCAASHVFLRLGAQCLLSMAAVASKHRLINDAFLNAVLVV